MVEEHTGNDNIVEEHVQNVEESSRNTIINLQEREENNLSLNKKGTQTTENRDLGPQIEFSHNKSQGISNNMLERKNITERFVNIKGKERIPNSGSHKASSTSLFKP